MNIQYEANFPSDILKFLQGVGHNITVYKGIGSAATVVCRHKGKIMANSDWRRQGTHAGF